MPLDATNTQADPLFRPTPKRLPYPVAVLPEPMKGAVEFAAATVQAPVEIAANGFMAAASIAAQDGYDVRLPIGFKSTRPVSLATLTVADSGDRKTTCDSMATKEIVAEEMRRHAAYEEEEKLYRNAKEVYENEKRRILTDKKSSSEQKRNAIQALEEPKPPAPPVILLGNPTMEGMEKLMRRGCRSLGIVNNEGGSFLGGHAMRDEQRLATFATLSALWEGAPLSNPRAKDEHVGSLFHRRITIGLMMQPIVADSLFGDPVAQQQGILARCLPSWPVSLAGQRTTTARRVLSPKPLDDFHACVRRLLARKVPTDPLTGAPQREVLELDDDAKVLALDFYDNIEIRLGPDGPLASIKDFAGKALEHVCRVAAIFHAIAGRQGNAIASDLVNSAIRIVAFHMTEMRVARAKAAVDPDLLLAEEVLRWLREKRLTVVGLPEIYTYGPSRVRSRDVAQRIVGRLVEHGHLSGTVPQAVPSPNDPTKFTSRKVVYAVVGM